MKTTTTQAKGSDEPFAGIKLHVVTTETDGAFTGIRLRDQDHVKKALEQKQKQRERMRPAPTSCVVEAIVRILLCYCCLVLI